MRPAKNVAIAHEKLPRPEMVLPREDGENCPMEKGGASSSGPAMLERPIGTLSSSIPERSIGWRPYGPERPSGTYYLFVKSDDYESAVKKAATEKWASLTEAEKYVYEVKTPKRTSRFEKYLDASRKLKQKQDVNEDEAEPAASSSEKSTPEVDDAKEGSS